jgi:ribosomal protein L7/L12
MDNDVAAALELINKRLDWIEESLMRVVGLQYKPMGRAASRPDEAGVPPEIVELVRAGKKLDAIKRYRELTGASGAQAQAVIDGV